MQIAADREARQKEKEDEDAKQSEGLGASKEILIRTIELNKLKVLFISSSLTESFLAREGELKMVRDREYSH